MRILYIQDSLGTGGAERSNAELWYFLRKKEITIKIVALEKRSRGVEKEILDSGFDVQFLNSGSFWNQVNQIEEIIKNFKPHLVHSVLFKAALRVRLTKFKINFLHIESLVNCTYDKIRYKDPKVNSMVLRFYEMLDKYTAKFGVDQFVAITHEVKKHYEKHLKIRKERISLIYRGRKENKYRNEREKVRSKIIEEFNLNSDKPIFIHVGRQEFQKAHLDILKAIKLRDQELSEAHVQFLFCGRKGNSSEEIEDFLANNQIKTTIKFLGHRNDIYKLLVAADVFVFPSLFEGLGGSLIEAQAAGLPIICSNINVFQEVVTPENALFHEVNDPVSLSERLIEILEMDLQVMSNQSIKNYEKNFKLEGINQQMLDFYNSFAS